MAAAAAQLLGEDGRGYELARRLEACGAWRAWLGDDAAHAALAQHLSSPSTWDAFLSPAPGASAPPRPLLLLQLRVRALLFDKASAALILSRGSGPAGLHSFNANYLQLHGDDIYFSLEDEQDDNTQHQMHSRTAFSPRRDSSMLSQRHNRYDELPDTWYKQYAEKFRTRRSKLHSGDQEIPKRTPEGMSNYLQVCRVHKRKRAVFLDGQGPSVSAPTLENGPSSKNAGEFNQLSDDFVPEIIFPADCVPESAIPRTSGISRTNRIEVHGVLDNLPAPVSRNTAMLERFGMMPDYYKTGNKYRGKDGSRVEGKSVSQEQASLMIRKLVARFLANSGFASGTAASIDVLSEILIKHICKLGRNLKLLTDSYRKQFSSVELLKMFLQTVGYSNIGPLMEIAKTGNRVANYPVHHDAQVLQSQNQNSLLHGQQLPRQFPQQMTIHTQNLTPQQQQQLLQQQQWRRNQMASPRGPLMMADKNQPLLNVKIENTMDSQVDGAYGALNTQQQLHLRHQQLLHQQRQQLQQQQLQQQQQQLQLNQQQQQLQQQQQQLNQRQQQLNQQLNQRHQLQPQQFQQHPQQQFQQQQQQQQQLQQQQQQQQQQQLQQQQQQQQQQQLQQQQQQQQMVMSANQNAQLAQQFKQAPSMSAYGMRMPPVKVEAFHELVSGDPSLKHDNDPNKLTSPK